MFNIDILTLFAFFGTLQGLIFAIIFWLRKKQPSNKIFALLLLVTSIRIAKNIFVHLRDLNPELFTSYDLWRTSIYIGLAHQFAIGPLFQLYFYSKLQPKFALRKSHLWHFLPYFLLIMICPFIEWKFWANGGLLLSYASILIYSVWTFWYFHKNRSLIDKGTDRWLKGIFILAGLLLLAYMPALFHYMGYIGGAFLYTILLLSIGYVMLTNKGLLSFFHSKYETSSLRSREVSGLRNQLEEIMKTRQPFLDPELTLQSLASLISIQPHHLSRVINQEFKKSYADYINSFRLEEAARRLCESQYDHIKIAALAYECGFNSQPTFNTLFKKKYNLTPSQFRNKTRSSN